MSGYSKTIGGEGVMYSATITNIVFKFYCLTNTYIKAKFL